MSDFERYSDYNDYEDDEPRGKSPVGLILKILVGIVIISVVGIVAFRIIIFNSYPDSVKNIYYNDKLTAYYTETNGEIGAKTQGLRAEYDDPDKGNFFADNLIVIPDIDQLQISLRYNTSLMAAILDEYGVELDPDNPDNFEFSLSVLPLSKNDGTAYRTGELTYSCFEENMMYRYYKLVFDDVDLTLDGEKEVWIRLEIKIKGVEMEAPYMILVYEDTATSKLEDYVLSSKERP
jgi:hypothetical protein